MTRIEVLPRSRHVIAANVRARMAWKGMNGTQLAKLVGCSQNTMSMKLRGESPFTADELDILARRCFGLDDPGAFYREPDGFGSPVPPAVTRTSSRCIGPWAGQKACRRHRTGRQASTRHPLAVAA